MSRRAIAVIDWGSAASLKANVRFFRGASQSGKVLSREGGGHSGYRSLVLWEDGTCELQRFSPASVARRLGGCVVKRKAQQMKVDRRG